MGQLVCVPCTYCERVTTRTNIHPTTGPGAPLNWPFHDHIFVVHEPLREACAVSGLAMGDMGIAGHLGSMKIKMCGGTAFGLVLSVLLVSPRVAIVASSTFLLHGHTATPSVLHTPRHVWRYHWCCRTRPLCLAWPTLTCNPSAPLCYGRRLLFFVDKEPVVIVCMHRLHSTTTHNPPPHPPPPSAHVAPHPPPLIPCVHTYAGMQVCARRRMP